MKSTLPGCPTIDLRLPGAAALTTERDCSSPDNPYDGFNACFYTGDDPLHTESCRHAIACRLGLADPALLIMPRQTHTCRVASVTSSDAGRSLEDVDALVTADPEVALGVSTADCVPLLMVDPVAGVAAAVHSGWRGTAGHIAAHAVEAMTGLGASPRDIRAALGPCICTDCFEVGEEVAEAFTAAGLGGAVRNDFGIKPHIDLAKAVSITLVRAGVAPPAPPPGCSRCLPGRFFSARRLGIASGRTLTVIRLNKTPGR